MKSKFKILLLGLLFIGNYFICKAQVATISVDKKDILIGEKIILSIISDKQNGILVPDTIPHFEIITKEFKDTTVIGTTFIKTNICFTSFDSGVYNFPVLYNKKNEMVSDSFLVNVGYMPIDKDAKPRDIKNIIEVDYINYNIIKWVCIALGVILFLALVLIIFFSKRKKAIIQQNKNAYKEALNALQNLHNKNEEQKISVKELHTSLATIFKTYYSAVGDSNMLAKTSNEVLQKLDTIKLQAEIAVQTKTALETGDATKFAQYQPLVEENKNAISFIKNTIDGIENLKNKH